MKYKNYFFNIALSKSNSKIEESVFIGDSEIADIGGSYSIGMDSILISEKKANKTKANWNMNLEELLKFCIN